VNRNLSWIDLTKDALAFKIKNHSYRVSIKKEREGEREHDCVLNVRGGINASIIIRWRGRSHITRRNVSMSECIFHRSVRVGIFHRDAIDARTIHQSYGDGRYALRSVHTWKRVCTTRMDATFVYVHLSRAVDERWNAYCKVYRDASETFDSIIDSID